MGDSGNKLPDLGDVDWDAALDEWEQKAFSPEVAREKESAKAVPKVSPAVSPDLVATAPNPAVVENTVPTRPPEAEKPPAAAASAPRESLKDLPSDGTVIAPVPQELREDRAKSAPRGGLSQLFARNSRPPSAAPRPSRPSPSSDQTRVALPSYSSETDSIETLSAKAHPTSEPTITRAALVDDELLEATHARPSSDQTLAAKDALRRMDSATTAVRASTPDWPPDLGDEPPPQVPPPPTFDDVSADDSERGTLGYESQSAARSVQPMLAAASVLVPVEVGDGPPSKWMDEEASQAFRKRAAWLEEEGRAAPSPAETARALLVVSELRAIVGDTERAYFLATDAREMAPDIALAWQQSRNLMPRDETSLVTIFDAEATHAHTPAARAHAALMAADLSRLLGDQEAAVERWNAAATADSTDPRGPALRAAAALATENPTAGTERLTAPELATLDNAIAASLRLRGHPREETQEGSNVTITEALRLTRNALETRDASAVIWATDQLAKQPALANPARWLSAAFGAIQASTRRSSADALLALAKAGDVLAARTLAARGVELDDGELVADALSSDAPIDLPDRAALLALAGRDPQPLLDKLAERPELRSLLDALSVLTLATGPERAEHRADQTAGSSETRALARVGRLLAAKAGIAALDTALADVEAPHGPSAVGVALEAAVRGARWKEVASALSSLSANASSSAGHVAAALISERAKDRAGAVAAWRAAAAQGDMSDVATRALASLDDAASSTAQTSLARDLLRLADGMPEGIASAILRLEALNLDEFDAEEQARILERVHEAVPHLGIGAFLAERIGRRKGDLEGVLRWIRERRERSEDPQERALDAVREALLIADDDPELASARVEEAQRLRPDDVALRELYERLATEPPEDRGAWRVRRAKNASGPLRALLLVEASLEHERLGNFEAAEKAATDARDAGDTGLSRVVIERAQRELGELDRRIDELQEEATKTESDRGRLHLYERLAELEAHGRKDMDKAVGWHQKVLETSPTHKPSLRYVEQALIGTGRHEEIHSVFEKIARALDGTRGGECTGHAQIAARLHARKDQGWELSYEMALLAAKQSVPSLWSLRALNGHARVRKDDEEILRTTLSLLERTQRPQERSALLVRAGEASQRMDRMHDAREFFDQAAAEDPGDVVTWGLLADLCGKAGDTRAAAEACESMARASTVPNHQLLAWYDAAKVWREELEEPERALSALEHAAEIDISHADIFPRLSQAYAEKRLDAELARLLERRLAKVSDTDERVTLEVELARALAEMGDLKKARTALESALVERPDHTTALAAIAEVCGKEGDWNGAEQAYVRLARLLAAPEEQRVIYEKLAEIYAVHTGNLSRAEVAYREVLKRAPSDPRTLERLVDLYKRQNDAARAIETQQELVKEASDPSVRLTRLIEVANIYETIGHDARKAEHAFEAARREFPTSVAALRALAEFYRRHQQMPAMQILLDRAAGDARRSFAAGRFVTSLFQVLHAAYELRGKKDAARVVAATLAAVEGQRADIVGADARAVDARLDEVLAPEVISPSLRALLYRAGDALDAVAPYDLRAVRAAPVPPGMAIGTTITALAAHLGLGGLSILVAPQLGRVAIPLSSHPPALVIGEGLMQVEDERARTFVIVRALKMILARGSPLMRGTPDEVAALVSGLFTAFNPSFSPHGIDAKRVVETTRKLAGALPKNLDPTVGVLALEAAGALGTQALSLASAGVSWANRVALLAIGDPNAALDAIAWSKGEKEAPRGAESRAAWIARTIEARELMTFSVTDAYSEARARLGLDQ